MVLGFLGRERQQQKQANAISWHQDSTNKSKKVQK